MMLAKTYPENRASLLLRKAADLFEERNKVYGNNYLMVGAVMQGYFPEGITLKTQDDFNRFHIFMLEVVKNTRYCNNWNKPHQDSNADNTVYSAMREMIDRNIQQERDEVPF